MTVPPLDRGGVRVAPEEGFVHGTGHELGVRDVPAARPGVLEPGLAELARVLDRLLLAGAVVGALADAVALRAPGVVALGVAPADTAVAGVDGDERGHGALPVICSVR